jgi:AmmeMemoRadiSam system protein B/AmmeMemoRadiSam system protein A
MSGEIKVKYHYVLILAFVVQIVAIIFYVSGINNVSGINIREAFVAGQFYPSETAVLTSQIENMTNRQSINKNVRAIIVPHAGYQYSGRIAGLGYAQIDPSIKRVIIIANNHANNADYTGIAVTNYSYFETPLGNVKVSPIVKQLLGKYPFTTNANAELTHVIEVQLPFLHQKLQDFEIIPLIIGRADEQMLEKAANEIDKYVDENTLIVVSSDLSHYHPFKEALDIDTRCIVQIEKQKLESCEACGLDAIKILLKISEKRGWNAKILEYTNSGIVTGDLSSVVGYSAIAFYTGYSREEKESLLKLSRDTLEGKKDAILMTQPLKEIKGCFVTLNKGGQLRGCVGAIMPQAPLYECVRENTLNAAHHDSRFSPVTTSELDDIEIEISVLSEPTPLEYDGEADLLAKLKPRIDGVVMHSISTSTFLPQVWDQFSNKTAFLEALCEKQGAATDCWKSARYEVYEAEVWGE